MLYFSFISFHSTSLKFNVESKVENTIQKLIPWNVRIRASLQIIITCSKISHYKLCFKHLKAVTKLLVQRFTANDCFFLVIKYYVCQGCTRVCKKEANKFNFSWPNKNVRFVSKLSVKILVVYRLCSLTICQKKF